MAEVVALLAELLNIQTLTDTAVLHTSSMAVSPFFVEEISELQLSALKLVTTVIKKIVYCNYKNNIFLLGFFFYFDSKYFAFNQIYFNFLYAFVFYFNRYLQNMTNIENYY